MNQHTQEAGESVLLNGLEAGLNDVGGEGVHGELDEGVLNVLYDSVDLVRAFQLKHVLNQIVSKRISNEGLNVLNNDL